MYPCVLGNARCSTMNDINLSYALNKILPSSGVANSNAHREESSKENEV